MSRIVNDERSVASVYDSSMHLMCFSTNHSHESLAPLHSVLFQIYLTTFSYAISSVTSAFGLVQIPMMLNPIFESSSIGDFW